MPLCTILQLRPGEENHYRRWTPLVQWGEDYPRMSYYEQVYILKTNPASPETLHELFKLFTVKHPRDFFGHSLSISDVLLFEDKIAYFVDGAGVSFSNLDPDRFFDLPPYSIEGLFSGYVRMMGAISIQNEVIGTWQMPQNRILQRFMYNAAFNCNTKLVELPGLYPLDFKLENMPPDDKEAFIRESAKTPYELGTVLEEVYLKRIHKNAKDDLEKNTRVYGHEGILAREAAIRYNTIHTICVNLNIDI